MATLTELWNTLYRVPMENAQERKDLSFEILNLYCTVPEKERRTNQNIKAVSGAAIALSGIIEKGLSKRVMEFLNTHQYELPDRAVHVLQGNLRRMEGF